ncbi:hypothetical protein MGH68_08010 [Erysipelothrix sp. D19-032]
MEKGELTTARVYPNSPGYAQVKEKYGENIITSIQTVQHSMLHLMLTAHHTTTQVKQQIKKKRIHKRQFKTVTSVKLLVMHLIVVHTTHSQLEMI